MKKPIALVFTLVFVLGLVGCSEKEPAVWDWTQSLTQEDITSATAWSEGKTFKALNSAETLELVTLLNKLTKNSFTENKNLAGITPTFGVKMEIASETYNINYAPSPYGKYGTLEIQYNEKMWWIDSAELSDFVQRVTDTTPAE